MSFIEEINIDESYEKNIIRFKKSLTIISITSVLVVILMIFYNFYQSKITEKTTKATTDLISGLITDDYQIIDSVSNIANDGNEKSKTGVIQIADLQIALKEIRQKNYKKAVDKLDTIEKNKEYNDVTRYFARYLLCSLILDHSEMLEVGNKDDKNKKDHSAKNTLQNDNENDKNLDKKIEEYFTYFDSESKPFFASALTLKAIWLYKKDKLIEAKEILELIINSKASKMLKENALYVLSNIETEIKIRDKYKKNNSKCQKIKATNSVINSLNN